MPSPMIENLPYPDISGLKPDYRAARILMPAYADAESELTAVLQYVFHALNFDYRGLPAYASMMNEIAVAEMKHLDLLGTALIRLGVNPVFSRRPPEKNNFYSAGYVDYTTAPASMLLSDIASENGAIRMYENMLTQLENSEVSAMISRILLDEKLHLARLKAAYAELVNPNKKPV